MKMIFKRYILALSSVLIISFLSVQSFSATDIVASRPNPIIPGCTNNPLHNKNKMVMGLDNVLLYVETDEKVPEGEILPYQLKKKALTERSIAALKSGALRCMQSENPDESLKEPIILTSRNDPRILDKNNLTVIIQTIYFSKKRYTLVGPFFLISGKVFRPDNNENLIKAMSEVVGWQPVFPEKMSDREIETMISSALGHLND